MVKLTVSFLNKLKKEPLVVLKTLSQDEVASIIQHANFSYYNTKTPLISDNLFDMIKDYLEELNPQHPILKNIGSTVGDAEKKEELPYFMGSLDKIKSDEKALTKFKEQFSRTYVVSDKLDGNSALFYAKNDEVKLFSRGDGAVGQNISHLLPFLKHVPIVKKKEELAVRGELIISKSDFEKVKDKGANARNMVAGLVNAKVPDLSLVQFVQFVAYEVIEPKYVPVEQYATLATLGFKSAWKDDVTEQQLTTDFLSDILLKRRTLSDYEIDGIVVIHNDVHKRTKGNPKYGFAFKSVLTMEKAEVIVSEVEWNLSKDGYLIPVVHFNPVALAGVTIRRAHGFNGKFISDNKIGPGSRIVIMRSGDVIPYISEILSDSETGQPQLPKDVQFTWSESGVDIVMDKKMHAESDELRFKNLDYFFQKIDVKGLSSGNLKKIYDSGLKTVRDIFAASKTDLLKVEGFKDKMADKIVAAIKEKVATLDCANVMDASNALGRGIGAKKIALVLSQHPGIIKTRNIPTKDELLAIKGIEEKTAALFIENLPAYFKFVDDNDMRCLFDVTDGSSGPPDQAVDATVNPLDYYKKSESDFQGMKLVFTGFRNKDLESYITEHGGEVVGNVSKKTTMVICKDKDESSSKLEKAETLGVPIKTVDEFVKQYNIKCWSK